MMDGQLEALSRRVGETLSEQGLTLATAESCTGGWVAQVVTHTGGSSAWFDRGFVTYSNDAKIDMLGVGGRTLAAHGAVSPETAAEMATGALNRSNALISLAITGIAGPTGGSPDKPVGTVCFGWCRRGHAPDTERQQFAGDRETVRRQAVIHALEGLLARAKTVP
ncbi:MAG TPA: nicotinamide-nucleotide amidohydrolase family protein [Rhodocyclaceae bacterium]|nr:nicotinamide-nucleotide amidohydrolase family protein [Rhodocyclaceae bacterium]